MTRLDQTTFTFSLSPQIHSLTETTSSPVYLQLYAGTKMRPGRTTKAIPAATTPLLLLLPLILGRVGLAHAQCPWQRDVPDLQTSCICAYNLGRELSVQCDQVRVDLLFHIMI